MILLALDISTSSGFAVLQQDELHVCSRYEEVTGQPPPEKLPPGTFPPVLTSYGTIANEKTTAEYGPYPWGFLAATTDMARKLVAKVREVNPDIVVIEETNLGKNRYSQKALEFIHCLVLNALTLEGDAHPKVVYLSSSSWRHALGIYMGKEDKKLNTKLATAKRTAKKKGVKLDRKELGIRGKITKKHLALRYVNAKFGLSLLVKDNDAADAICLGDAYFHDAVPADGT